MGRPKSAATRAYETEQARRRRAANPEGERLRQQSLLRRILEERVRIAGRPKPSICEACGEHGDRIVFDHCHKRHYFRGWICNRCNRILGLAKDSAELLRKLAKYLDNNPEPTHNPLPTSKLALRAAKRLTSAKERKS